MTELEALATQTQKTLNLEHSRAAWDVILAAVKWAYYEGRAQARVTPAQLAAARANLPRGGKAGRKDKKPRHRRTKAEMDAARNQTQGK